MLTEKYYCYRCGCEEGQPHKSTCTKEHCQKCSKQIRYLWKNQIIPRCNCEPNKKDCEPYFVRCFCCVRCGRKNSMGQMVSDEEWAYIIGVTYDNKDVLCPDCMNFIKAARDKLKGGEHE